MKNSYKASLYTCSAAKHLASANNWSSVFLFTGGALLAIVVALVSIMSIGHDITLYSFTESIPLPLLLPLPLLSIAVFILYGLTFRNGRQQVKDDRNFETVIQKIKAKSRQMHSFTIAFLCLYLLMLTAMLNFAGYGLISSL